MINDKQTMMADDMVPGFKRGGGSTEQCGSSVVYNVVSVVRARLLSASWSPPLHAAIF